MRINITRLFKSKHDIDDERTIRKFLWFPMYETTCTGLDYEIRWLCYANVHQRFDYGIWSNGWKNICFADDIVIGEQKKA